MRKSVVFNIILKNYLHQVYALFDKNRVRFGGGVKGV